MNKWEADIETHSRADVMKVCALLARGIGKDAILSRRVSVAVYDDRKNVSFYKGAATGKTAITDGLVAAFSDNYTAYNLPQAPLIEEWPNQIMFERLAKIFKVAGQDTVFTLTAVNFKGKYDDTMYGILRERINDQFKKIFIPEWQRGLDLTSGQKFNGAPNSNIVIKFNKEEKSDDFWNSRQWNIKVNDPRLHTDQMAQILSHLRNFNNRRQARLENTLSVKANLA